jgi:hypothetical protein
MTPTRTVAAHDSARRMKSSGLIAVEFPMSRTSCD